MRSLNKDWLRRDKVTGEWFRVICRSGGPFLKQFEILLYSPKWKYNPPTYKDVNKLIIRNGIVKKSLYTHELPDVIADKMMGFFKPEEFNNLIHADIINVLAFHKVMEYVKASPNAPEWILPITNDLVLEHLQLFSQEPLEWFKTYRIYNELYSPDLCY